MDGQELVKHFEDKEKKGEDAYEVEDTVLKGWGKLRIAGDKGVKTSGQLILAPNTTGEVIGPMSLCLLSNCEDEIQEWDHSYVGIEKAAVSLQGVSWLMVDCQVRSKP